MIKQNAKFSTHVSNASNGTYHIIQCDQKHIK